MVSPPGTLVSIDARLPNRLVEEAVIDDWLEGFEGYTKVEREVRYGRSRLDLLLEGEDRRCWVEAKSVTLVREGIGYFPDAVTSRGRRHLEELHNNRRNWGCQKVFFMLEWYGYSRLCIANSR